MAAALASAQDFTAFGASRRLKSHALAPDNRDIASEPPARVANRTSFHSDTTTTPEANMKNRQTGFTLIELIMVIVILGVLAAVAIPKFTNLSADANTAAVQSVAGSLGAAAATNYAIRSAKSTNGVAITSCATAVNTLQGGALPTGSGGTYAISDASSASGATVIAANATATCTLTFTPTSGTAVTATFVVTGIA